MNNVPGLPDLKFIGIDPAQCGLEGRRISYMTAGDDAAPPLLLLHGIGSNSTGWRFLFEALAPRYRVIAWNAPGYMLSDNFSAAKPSNLQYADALAALLDALGLGSVFLVGSSFGSMVAATFAAHHPGRVRRLVLSGSSRGQKWRSEVERAAALQSRKDSIRDGALAMAELRWSNLVAPNPSELTKRLTQEVLKATNRRGFLQAAEALNATDVVEFAGNIKAPTLLAIGSQDRINPPEISRTIQRSIPASQLIELEGVGHLPKLEAPALFAMTIESHLGGSK